MLKLMKYEFRKLRTTLAILLGTLAVLEIAFVLGVHLEKDNWVAVSLVLLSILVFATYGYVLVAGVVSYSRELSDRTGYLVFMTPTRPIGIVLSKLLFTLLAGTAITALFALAAYLDYAYMMRSFHLDKSLLDQINMSLKFMLGDLSVSLNTLAQAVVFTVLTVLIGVMLAMCTAYLAITVSATALQNRKGFLRALLSALLFFALTWGSGWLTERLTNLVPRLLHTGALSPASMDHRTLMATLAADLVMNFLLGGLFAVVSASLLKRKVSL